MPISHAVLVKITSICSYESWSCPICHFTRGHEHLADIILPFCLSLHFLLFTLAVPSKDLRLDKQILAFEDITRIK